MYYAKALDWGSSSTGRQLLPSLQTWGWSQDLRDEGKWISDLKACSHGMYMLWHAQVYTGTYNK